MLVCLGCTWPTFVVSCGSAPPCWGWRAPDDAVFPLFVCGLGWGGGCQCIHSNHARTARFNILTPTCAANSQFIVLAHTAWPRPLTSRRQQAITEETAVIAD